VKRLGRVVAALVALAGIVVGLVGLVRSAALAADEHVVWPLPQWWDDLAEGSVWWVTAIVAAGVALAAIACLLLGSRQLTPSRPPATVETGGVQVKLAALERLVAGRLAAELPGLKPVRVRVLRSGEGWEVAAQVDVPPHDLSGVWERAARVVGPELERAAGGTPTGLVLEVRRFVGEGA